MRESKFEATVSAARSGSYDPASVRKALRNSLDSLEPPLPAITRPGHRVLVKVNLGCSGSRSPANRLTTHPAVAEAIIEALLDCGARVSFGDDVSRAGQYCEAVYKATGMAEVADRTGATLIDFVATGAREIPSGLLFPSSYLVTNAYFESDAVVNAANCRSGPVIVGMSAAIKNMFGCVVGRRKQAHTRSVWLGSAAVRARDCEYPSRHPGRRFIFGHDDCFGRLRGVARSSNRLDCCLPAPTRLLSIRLPPMRSGTNTSPCGRPSTDMSGALGCNDMDRIRIQGIEWSRFEKPHLRDPSIEEPVRELPWARATQNSEQYDVPPPPGDRRRPMRGMRGVCRPLSREMHFRGSSERLRN